MRVGPLMLIMIIHFFLASCQIDSNLSGNRGISNNIKESKKRGVFLSEYTTPQNPYMINDSIILNIQEAWLEVTWFYRKDLDKTLRGDKFRICILTTPEYSLKSYEERWFVENGAGGVRGVFGQVSRKYNFLSSSFDNVPPDSMILSVREGPVWDLRFRPELEKKIIGKLELIKKK